MLVGDERVASPRAKRGDVPHGGPFAGEQAYDATGRKVAIERPPQMDGGPRAAQAASVYQEIEPR